MKIFCLFSLLAVTVGGARLNGLEHHGNHQHHEMSQDFPLATGNEASHSTARINEFFNAVLDDKVQFPSDMPSYHNLPDDIQFTCDGKLPGYYADVNYGCQVYHLCRDDPNHGLATNLCPNETIFDQVKFACDWWFNVDCSQAPANYHLNADLYKVGRARLDGLEHQDFPLATGEETIHSIDRLNEFFNAVLDDKVQFPSDMPSYHNLPDDIHFTCEGKLPGYYADVNYGCQVYHVCRDNPIHGVATFLCPNATVFDQVKFACDVWIKVDCSQAPANYHLNADLYKIPEEEEEGNMNGGQRRQAA